MASPLRLEFAHALYHATSRGDRREDIYDDADRAAWLVVLAQVCERFNWTVHPYCLMSNHYHLLVERPMPIYPQACAWVTWLNMSGYITPA